MFLLQGYLEDVYPSDTNLGPRVHETEPILDVALCVSHAVRLAKALQMEGAGIRFRFLWNGLKKRVLQLTTPGMLMRAQPICCQNYISSSDRVFTASEIETAFCEVVRIMTEPLYTAFALYKPLPKLIDDIVNDLKERVGHLWEP
jgi:hypothetical protein